MTVDNGCLLPELTDVTSSNNKKKGLKLRKTVVSNYPFTSHAPVAIILMKTMENHKFYQVINRQYGPKNFNSSLNSD